MPPKKPVVFDRAYYERFYVDPKTRVLDSAHIDRLGDFVFSYLKYLELPVRRVLDLGCGVGHWRGVVERHFPKARYTGVEYSEYLCERFGWEHGSVVTYRSKRPYDVVICQGVLPYLGPADARRAIDNLGALSSGALYLEAVTREDWDHGILDRRRTDRAMQLRPASFYRRALRPHFRSAGGGLWLCTGAPASLYELEGAS